jgi:hypothetical protein
MRRIDTSAGSVKLRDALRTLRTHLEATQADWDDDVRRRFEERYIEPLQPCVLATVQAMTNLLQALAKAQQDCA